MAGMANAQWKQLLKRVGSGLVAGGIGGAIGGALGDFLYATASVRDVLGEVLSRSVGWMMMGAGIGVVEGLYERSPAKLRNGLLGGAVGGLLGGFILEKGSSLISAGFRASSMSSAATAFVILGICIGVLIGLVKVALKEAWLTVRDGYRPGRQLILAEASVLLGRAEYATLPFMGRVDADEVELEHAHIIRQSGGQFLLVDNNSRTGVRVNNVRVNGSVILKQGDTIKIGVNSIEFNERHRRDGVKTEPAAGTPPAQRPAVQRPPIQCPSDDDPFDGRAGTWRPPAAAQPASRPVLPASPPQPVARVQPPKPAAAPPPVRPAVPPPQPQKPAAAAPPPIRPAARLPAPQPQKPAAVAPPPIRPAAPPPPRPQKPAAAGPPPRQSAPAPQPADGALICPSCGRAVPKASRYCLICELNV